MPEVLPDDDVCYIISKYIYLKKRTGLVDSLVKVDHIGMGEEIGEYATMNLPKIKPNIIGKVLGLFKMVYAEHRSECGVIMNLKSHPEKPTLKKIDYTLPHQRVSGSRCKYEIVINPNYINCGTIHSHCDFGAFHSGTDENDERFFDGLHITIGHVDTDRPSISVCIVVNGKRISVDPLHYIEGIKYEEPPQSPSPLRLLEQTKRYNFVHKDLIVENRDNLKFIEATYTRKTPSEVQRAFWDMGGANKGYLWDSDGPNKGYLWDWSEDPVDEKPPCAECIFKEDRVESLFDEMTTMFEDEVDDSYPLTTDDGITDIFDENDRSLFEGFRQDDPVGDELPKTTLFKEGEVDEDGVKRTNNKITPKLFATYKDKLIKKYIKCQKCESTYFVPDSTVKTLCPSCEKWNEGLQPSLTREGVLKSHKKSRYTW